MSKFRKGLVENIKPNIWYLHGRIDGYELLEALEIEAAYQLGDNIMCHCPNLTGAHGEEDSHPSFGLNMEKMKYNCFTCGGGDLIDLVCMMKPLNWQEAEGFLVELAHLDPDADTVNEKLKAILNPPKQEEEVLPTYPEDNLFQYKRIHPYLYKRGITDEVAMEMQVGFDEEHLGIIIPHFYAGKLRGWQTRHLAEPEPGRYACPSPHCAGKHVPKYKNTKSFPKRTTLYNYDNVLNAGYRTVIVVESPFTALYLMSNGIKNVVAHFGSPITHAQCMLLVRFETVVYWSDNDQAGLKSVHALMQHRRFTNIMLVPVVPGEKSDAANLAPEQLQPYLDKAYSSSLFTLVGLTDFEGKTTLK